MPQYFENDTSLENDYKTFDYAYAGLRFRAVTNSGIFSPGHVDEGTDILIKSLPAKKLHGNALDLGCGCGIIGAVLAKRFSMNMTLSDINERAVDCALRTLEANGVTAKTVVSDGFEKVDGMFDLITLNPPVHAGKGVMFSLYAGACAHLKDGGSLYTVIRKKHGAESTAAELLRLFGNCTAIYKKSGVFVYECEKRARQ